MKLNCPECRQMLQLPDGQEGRQGRCPKCGAIFRIGDEAPFGSEDSRPEFDEPVRETPLTTGADSEPKPGPISGLGEQWQLRIADGRVFGPVDRATLDQWVREGRVGQDSQLKRAGDPDWQSAKSFYPYLRTGSASQSGDNPFSERQSPTSINTGSAIHPGSSPVQSHRGGVVLTLGLLGFCCWICGIVAIVMGSQDLNKMKTGYMDRSGEGITRAGFILGIISTVLGVLGILGQFAPLAFDINF